MTDSLTRNSCTSSKEINVVFEGGGVKGVGLVGALSILEERGYQIRHVAGASAGSIVAVLFAAGYTAVELFDIAQSSGFGEFRDRDWIDRIPVLGMPLSIFMDHGIYEGDLLTERLRSLLAARGIHTFRDLEKSSAAPKPVFKHKAQVVVSDLTARQLLVLPRDAGKLGIDPNDLDVALSVRMSVSIPVFFEPVEFVNPCTGRTHVLVDGGMLSNFPVWLFDDENVEGCLTIGISLDNDEPEARQSSLCDSGDIGLDSMIDFAKDLASTVMLAHDTQYLERSKFARTISVPNLGIGTTEFELNPAQSHALYQAGRMAADAFLDSWESGEVSCEADSFRNVGLDRVAS